MNSVIDSFYDLGLVAWIAAFFLSLGGLLSGIRPSTMRKRIMVVVSSSLLIASGIAAAVLFIKLYVPMHYLVESTKNGGTTLGSMGPMLGGLLALTLTFLGAVAIKNARDAIADLREAENKLAETKWKDVENKIETNAENRIRVVEENVLVMEGIRIHALILGQIANLRYTETRSHEQKNIVFSRLQALETIKMVFEVENGNISGMITACQQLANHFEALKEVTPAMATYLEKLKVHHETKNPELSQVLAEVLENVRAS